MALECKEYVRYLGIIIDHVAIKESRTVGLICKLRHFLLRHTLLTIYRSLVAPYLTYGLMAWGQACKSYLEKPLKLQKRDLSLSIFFKRNQHSIPLFIDDSVLQLKC